MSRELNNDNVLIPADKTTNTYAVSTQTYKKLLKETITKDYKIAPPDLLQKTNSEAKNIAIDLDLADRIEQYSDSIAFITLKDHKENFKNNPKCRLINPAKTNIGRISKQILQRKNKEIRLCTNLNQWQSTGEVLEWFKNITNKKRKRFMQLDIVEFYPSITEGLLDKALEFAKQHTEISKEDIAIIKHARQALLFTEDESGKTAWTKTSSTFDVTMGAPDGAEVCELVGLFILNEIRANFPELRFGLYRDDGLAEHDEEIGGRKLDQITKQLHQLFQNHGLRITIDPPNKTEVNFLDVTMNLTQNKYCPYRKPNDVPLYVHCQSNHPPNVLKTIPISVNKRLSNLSSSKKEFDLAKKDYQKALDSSGYKHTLEYEKNPDRKPRKGRPRDSLWFTPPYNKAVETNIGAQFLRLVDKHFPKTNPLCKILNRSKIKVSYSCTKSIKRTIQAHNTYLLTKQKTENQEAPTCNCQKNRKSKCPLKGECQQSDVVYQATVRGETEERRYIGSTNNFKKRYYSHTASFKSASKRYSTTLSTYIWEQKLGPTPEIRWEILSKAPSYKPGSRTCDLCLTEKLHISKNLGQGLLNKRGEIAQRCRHKARFLLQPPYRGAEEE